MKKQLSVQIFSYDRELQSIMAMIETVNKGNQDVSFRDFQGYFACMTAQYPYIGSYIGFIEDNQLHVTLKGKLLLTITQKEVIELEEHAEVLNRVIS